jgi:hypothetical protein
LSILRDVFRMLPAGVTVQDEHGEFVLMNDAAPPAEGGRRCAVGSQLSDRRETCLELLRAGRPAVLEEAIAGGSGQAGVSHLASARPGRRAQLLISSSTDITEQKAFEDHLFRSAYYDELTGLPTRRVIEHRVNSLLNTTTDRAVSRWRFSTSTISSTSTTITDTRSATALLAEMAKRLGWTCANPTSCRGSAATSSCCCSTRSRATPRSKSSSTSSCSG